MKKQMVVCPLNGILFSSKKKSTVWLHRESIMLGEEARHKKSTYCTITYKYVYSIYECVCFMYIRKQISCCLRKRGKMGVGRLGKKGTVS